MSIKTSNENICINRIIFQKEENFIVEGDEIVPDIKPDVLNIISTNGNVCIYKKEIKDGKIKIDGTINIYTIYMADNETASMRCIYSCLDFSKMIEVPDIKEDMQLEQSTSIKSIDARILNGRKINLKVTLNTNLCVYSNEHIDIIKDVENLDDIQKLKKTCTIHSLIGMGNTNVYAKDTLKIEKIDNLLEVIKVKISITNKETKISYNKVLAKADMNVKIVYITDDNRINSASISIPIMGFIDIQNVNENHICDVSYQLKNLTIKPNNMEEHSIYIDAEIEIGCLVYDNRDIEIIQDLYSPSRGLNYKEKDIRILKDKRNIKQICNIRNSKIIPEIEKNKIYDVEVKPTILNRQISDGKVFYDGEINLTFLFGKPEQNGEINSKTIVEPFNFNIEDDNITNDSQIKSNIEILTQDFIVMPDESIEIKVDLEIHLSLLDTENIKMISEVEESENINRETHSIVIYYTKPGDTLWNIAKRFGSTITDIVRVNNIEDQDKIISGEQLFIPR